MIRIGVLGAGNHSRRNHGPALRQCRDERPEEIELRAVCDLDQNSALQYAKNFGFETTYEDLGQMITNEPLDAVIAVTPVEATREIVGELLTYGLPVLIEKPPGNTVMETRELRKIAMRHGTPHAVSFNRRFNPAVKRAREWMNNGPDQPPTHALARLFRTGRHEDKHVKNTGLHAADTVCSFLGRPMHVTSRQWRTGASSVNGGTRCAARATFPDASAQFTFVSDSGKRAETYELFGPKYTVRIDTEAAQFNASADGETVASWQASGDSPSYEQNGTLGETRAFLKAVGRETGFAPTLCDAMYSVDLAIAMDEGCDRRIGQA